MTICAVSADLRKEEARQDRLERSAPTPAELRCFIDDWLTNKCNQMGTQFITEGFIESDDYLNVFRAYQDYDDASLGMYFRKAVEKYWRPMAEEAANSHDFDRDRREALV